VDAFELLGLGSGLVLDEDDLRRAFDRKVGEEHPDAGGEGDGFAQVRAAYETLRSPGRRLRHWLELGGVEWEAGGQVPAGLMAVFSGMGDLLMRVDGLAARKAEAQSALARSLLEREGMGLMDETEAMRDRVATMQEGAVGRFAGFEEAGAEACAREAAEVARTLLFLEKWDGQLRDRWAGLAG
jgi:curved DNA-binding protein CbpA